MTLDSQVTREESKPEVRVIYQDEYFVAIDKPSGLFVHKSFMDRHEKYFALQLVRDQIGQYVYPLHRLDRPTSGVLLFALSQDVARLMGEQFSQRKVKKAYLAITRGYIQSDGIVDYALKEKLDKLGDKHVSKDKAAQEAVTAYHVLAHGCIDKPLGKYSSVRYSLVKLNPETGRRHQIRRHLAHLRHPIIGDINYGDNKQNPFFGEEFGFKRLMLHAQKLHFIHPVSEQPVTIETSIDDQWRSVFQTLQWDVDLTK